MDSVTIPEDLDRVLLDSPWLGKRDQHGRYRLFKYAPTSDGTSYILVTTDLTSIEIHQPPASEISSIPWSTEHAFLAQTQEIIQSSGVEEEEDDQERLILNRLGEMMSVDWNDVQVMSEHEDVRELLTSRALDNFRLGASKPLADDMGMGLCSLTLYAQDQDILYLKSDGFGWRFPLSPLNPTQHLQFIARHLVSPLTSLIAQDRGIPTPTAAHAAASPLDPSLRLVSDPEISRAIKRVSSSTQLLHLQTKTTTSRPRSAAASDYSRRKDRGAELDVTMESTSEAGSPTPRRPVRQVGQNPKQAEIQSPTKKSMLPPPLTDSSSLAPSSSPPRSTPPAPAPAHNLRSDRQPSSSLPPLSSTPIDSSPPPTSDLPPSKKQKTEQRKSPKPHAKPEDRSSPSLGSAMDFNPPSSSSRTSHTQSSQKSKKEREKDEEDEMQRKIGEMKRKMEKGGTGRLGKRRLAR
ncbi:hypothetical protein IAT40_005163 [Kwoniella sp. CBS 6097]